MLRGAVSVCNPYDFYALDQHLEHYMFGIYHKVLGQHMLKMLKEHMEECRPLEKKLGYTLEEGISRVHCSRDFDTNFTSYMFDYHTAFNYYRKASCALKIDDIRTPELFIAALDDPVVT